jgi:hypothetical protein
MRIPECGLLLWVDGEFAGNDALPGQEPPNFVGGLFFTATGRVPLDKSLGERPFQDKLLHALVAGSPLLFCLGVWIGRQVIDSYTAKPVRLTHVIAHELRHVEQFLHNPQLHFAGNVAYQYLSIVGEEMGVPICTHAVPQEWDAELRAREVVGLMHDANQARAFYASAGAHDLIEVPPVRRLEQAVDDLRDFLTLHRDRIELLLQRPELYPQLGHLVQYVDWSALGAPDPTPPGGVAKEKGVYYQE